MSQWLYLPPHNSDSASPRCLWWHTDGALNQGDLKQAAEALSPHSFTLLLPMEIASYHQVCVPARSGRWLRQALCSAVEEQLIDEPDNLHLAHAPLREKNHWAIIAINRVLLSQCLAQLAEQGLCPSHIHIDADCLPSDKPLALEWDGRWLIGGNTSIRLALIHDQLNDLCLRLPTELQWQSPQPPVLEQPANLNWQADERPWACFKQGQEHAIDLCQGDFQQHPPQTPLWRTALLAGALIVTAHTVQNLGLSAYLNVRSNAIEHQTQQLWQQRFPDAETVIDISGFIRNQQQNSLAPDNSVALRLSQLAQQWNNSHGAVVQVQRLEYTADEGWTLHVNASAFSDLQQLRENLLAQGLDASTDSAVRDTQGISARFQIKE